MMMLRMMLMLMLMGGCWRHKEIIGGIWGWSCLSAAINVIMEWVTRTRTVAIKRIFGAWEDSRTLLSLESVEIFNKSIKFLSRITCSWFDYVSQGRSSAPYISQGTQIRQSFWTKSRNLLHIASLQNQTVRLPSDQNQTISTSPKVPKPNHLTISQGTKTNPSQHLPSSRNQTISTSPK